MNKPLIVCALEAETQGQLKEYDVLYTGVGKVNATIRLMEKLGGIFLAIIQASKRKVPLPHIGSKKSSFLFQLESKIKPEAKTSLRGASLVFFLYPR